jgi:hypothetical protein
VTDNRTETKWTAAAFFMMQQLFFLILPVKVDASGNW